VRENVGLVREKDDGIVRSHLRQRSRQVVDAAEAAVPKPIRELIAQAGEPKSLSLGAQHHRIVLEQRNARVRKRAADVGNFVPPIVVAEDRPRTERRADPRQFARPDRVRNALIHKTVCRGVIAEQDDKVGFQSTGGICHAANVGQCHVRAAGVEVRDDGHGKLAARRPAGRIERVARDDEALRFDGAGVGAGCDRGEAD
jgi:hypothetical protein